ncbi:MAG: hypothetical protein FWD18_03105 [Micrococcales bacterium]|nr:hypothetical protein [Micrococcales bacterium]
MVATVLDLRLRLFRASLRRNAAVLVAWLLAAASVLAMVLIAGASFTALGLRLVPQHQADTGTWVVIAGSVLCVAWAVLPPLLFGLDQTLDPARFAPFPLRGADLAPGLVAASFVGLPGIATLLAASTTVMLWVSTPRAMLPAFVGAVLGTSTCMVVGRLTTTVLAGVLSSRRGRDASVVLGAALFGGAYLVLVSLTQGRVLQDLTFDPTPVGVVLSWTPLGAPWAAGGAAAAGDWLGVAAHLGLAVLYVLLLVWAYGRALDRALTAPPAAQRGTRSRRDAVAQAVARTSRAAWFPVLAVAARARRYWAKDPRYLAGVPVLVLLPLVMVVMSRSMGVLPGVSDSLVHHVALMGCEAAGLAAGLILLSDIGFDSTAWWLHLTAGVPGWADRLGRALGQIGWAVPGLVVLCVVVTVALGSPADAPALIGSTLCAYLVGLGVASVLSAVAIYPVVLPGANPLSSRGGLSGLAVVTQLGGVAATLLLWAPVGAAAHLTPTSWGWLVAGVGVIWGVVVLAAGVVLGGRAVDARGPAIMALLVKNGSRASA